MYKRALYVRKWALHTLCHGKRSLQISPWTAILCIYMFQYVWKRALYVRRRALHDLCRGKRSLQISSRTAIMCSFMSEYVYRAVHVRKRVHDTFRFHSYWAHQSFNVRATVPATHSCADHTSTFRNRALHLRTCVQSLCTWALHFRKQAVYFCKSDMYFCKRDIHFSMKDTYFRKRDMYSRQKAECVSKNGMGNSARYEIQKFW